MRSLSRRTLLRATGVAVALPVLEIMHGPFARAADGEAPCRLITFFVPNGLPLEFFTPAEEGMAWTTTPLLEPLAAHRDALTIVSGIMGVGGPDSHAAGICAFSTGQLCTPLGAAGPSIEQVAAAQAGADTPYSSLAVAVQDSGQWSSNGYSSACFVNGAWLGTENPLPADRDPTLLFQRLFGDGTPAAALEAERRAAYRHSVLDAVQDDLARLQPRLGAADRTRLQAHLDAVRELEQRIDVVVDCEVPPAPTDVPVEIWQSGYYRRAHLQIDLLAMAIQCGLTNYASFMLTDGAGTGGPDLEVGLEGHHHELAHAGEREQMRVFSTVHMQAFARLLDRLAAASEGDGSVLDRSLVVLGTELGDGTGHTPNDLPFVLAGAAGGALAPGRHVRFQDAPIAALHLTLLRRAGIDVPSFAGATEELGL